MELRVLGWRCCNLRGGLRDLSINLDEKPSRWVLIQMPNGLGKTTTMSLLRATLSGEALSADAVRDLRASEDVDSGSFELRLSVNDKPLRIELRLNFGSGEHAYWTSRAGLRSGGLEEGRSLPSDLKSMLSPEFTRLFVFDGELAKEIRTVGKDRAATAIRTLYGLDRLDALRVQVTRLIEEKQRKAAAISTATERTGVTRWKRALEVASAREGALKRDLGRRRKAFAEAEERTASVQKAIDARVEQDGSLKARKDALTDERIGVDRDVLAATGAALASLRAPAKLHPAVSARLRALGERLTTLKLPKTISSEFFHELAHQPKCVCGREITPPIREAILERAASYLAEDQVLVINRMKLALRESGAETSGFGGDVEALKASVRVLNANRAAQDQLELERVESGDVELERLRAELSDLRRDMEAAGCSIELLSTRDHARQRELGASENNNIPLCVAEVKRCRDKHATATDTVTFSMQAERLSDIVAAVTLSALDRLRERIRASTNVKLQRLIPSEAIQVGAIGGSLELASSGVARRSNVSEGQSLAVAYAFLTSLLAEAPCKLPFIVDSPAVSLDTAVRREVGDLIPDLFDQMIMFVISSEREGFGDAFYSRRSVRYLTISRRRDEQTEVKEGKAAFQAFHQSEARR